MIAFLAGLFGLLIGSFLNVCIYRWPRDLSVVKPRSHCPHCEKTIAWYDNIPVVSYLLLRARCRHCGASIAFRYPVVEALTGALFFAAVRMAGPTVSAVKLCVYCAILIALIFSDLEARILPDEFTLGGTVPGIAFSAFTPSAANLFTLFVDTRWLASLLDSVFAAGFSAFMLWGMGALYKAVRHREGLGFGDVKMVAMIGSFVGLQGVLITLMLGSTLGAVTGLVYIKMARKDPSTYELPLGTFLGIAALIVAFLLQQHRIPFGS